jgi:hypothetical protein
MATFAFDPRLSRIALLIPAGLTLVWLVTQRLNKA